MQLREKPANGRNVHVLRSEVVRLLVESRGRECEELRQIVAVGGNRVTRGVAIESEVLEKFLEMVLHPDTPSGTAAWPGFLCALSSHSARSASARSAIASLRFILSRMMLRGGSPGRA